MKGTFFALFTFTFNTLSTLSDVLLTSNILMQFCLLQSACLVCTICSDSVFNFYSVFLFSSQDVDHVSEAPGLCRGADGRQTGDGSVGDRRDSGKEAGGAGLRQGGETT